jgi:hypothetical protein
VRLESIKLFEVSSFSAMLQRGRRNFPLIPPLVEIPYVGSFISVPIPGAKEFHRSTAIISAIVVPTAADIANGLVFTGDRVVFSPQAGGVAACEDGAKKPVNCATRKAISTADLNGPIRNYHKAMVRCFAMQFVDEAKYCSIPQLNSMLPDLP